MNIFKLLRNSLKLMLVVVFVVLSISSAIISNQFSGSNRVQAATSDNLNFQARLLTSSGNTVPDGYYNLEFKIYNVSSGGSALWTETRDYPGTDQRVRTVNGYFSVNLGSVTALPDIDYSQNLWLSMNVGGSTTSPSYDGEMTPRIKLTAVPYALQAKKAEQLNQTTAGGGVGTVDFASLTADRLYLLPDSPLATTGSPGTICIFNGSSSNCPAATGSANYIQNATASQTLQVNSNFHIQATDNGVNGSVGGIISAAAGGQTVDLFQLRASNGSTVLTHFDATGRLAIATSAALTSALTVGTNTTTAAGGITFGTDTNLYRSAADTLKTDDALVVGNALQAGTSGANGFATDSAGSRAAINSVVQANSVLTLGVSGVGGFNSSSAVNGLYAIISNSSTGDVTGVVSRAQTSAAANVNNLTGGSFDYRFASTNTLTNGYGLRVLSPTISAGGTVTNSYGLNIAAQKITGVTNGYGIYQSGASDFNYFGGNVGIGTSSPTDGRLQFATGTTETGGIVFGTGANRANLYQSANDTLKTDDTFVAVGGLQTTGNFQQGGGGNYQTIINGSTGIIRSTATNALTAKISGDTVARIALTSDGKINFSNGSVAADTNLYRSNANELKTDNSLVVGTIGAGGTNLLCYDGSNKLATCSGAPGAGSYINNSTSLQTTANFNIQSAAAGSVGGIIRGATSQTADLFQLQNSSGTVLTHFDASGNLAIGTAAVTTSVLTIGTNTTNAAGGITFGTDTNLYRSGTNTLATNDILNLDAATSSTGGYIAQGGSRFIHTYGGSTNFFAGINAGNFTTTGVGLTGIGQNALLSNTTGLYNVGIGTNAVNANTTGSNNLGIGYLSLNANSAGDNNVGIGTYSLLSNTASNNSAIGALSLYNNTSGTFNAGLGAYSLALNTTGSNNLGLGTQALYGNTTASGNTGIGTNALFSNSTGANNIAIGYQAGYTSTAGNANTVGSNNTFIGYNSGPGVVSATSLQNAVAIGANAIVNQNNSVVLGCINGINGCSVSSKVGIGTAAPTYTLDVQAGTGIVGQFSGRVIGGDAVNTNEFTTLSQLNAAASGTNFIQNSTSLQSTANFNIQSAAAGSVGGIIRGATSQTADLFQLQNSAGTILTSFDKDGKLVFGPSGSQDTNIYRSTNDTLRTNDSLIVDGNVGIGTTSLGSKLTVNKIDYAADGYDVLQSNSAYKSGTATSYSGIVGANTYAQTAVNGSAGAEAYGLISQAKTTNDAFAQMAIAVQGEVTTHAGDTGYVLQASQSASSTGGTVYGLYIDLQNAATTRYGIYQNSANNNYLAGNLGLGTSSPTNGRLQFATGTTEAGGIVFGTGANRANLYQSGNDTLKTDDNFLVQTATNSITAFQIQNAAADTLFRADTSSNIIKIGNSTGTGTGTTIFQLDGAASAPFGTGQSAYLGSMYYDTGQGKLQCYENRGGTPAWGACGSAPDDIVTLTPEYTGAVLNGSGVGTLTADFCANSAALTVGTLCDSNDARNFYSWTSPQATQQTYGIYVTYKLPTTFNNFLDDNTISLTARTDNTTNGIVTYEVFKSSGGAIAACGSATDVTTPGGANVWSTVSINGNENSSCGFSGGDNVIFKINVKAKNSANVYVENLNFTYGNL